MKVLLVGVNSKFIHSNLAIRYLKAFTEDIEYECIIREFSINDRVERIVEEIIFEDTDIVAFSCYIWNIEFVVKAANLIKKIKSDINILYGGPEVSYDAVNFLKSNVGEYVIESEGEETYREFIQSIIKGSTLNNVKGLYLKDNNKIVYGGKRELMDLNKVVFPYSINDDLKNKIVYYEASRGCPFLCKYCLSSTEHKVRFLDIERVKNDLKILVDNKVKLIKFVDRTFNINNKFALDIWKFLIDLDTETVFHFEISADILNDEQIALLSKAPKGRFQFEIGVQSTNDEVLKNINRFVHFDEIKKQVIRLNEFNNIKQHLDLIAGLPGEDINSFKKSFNDLYAIKPHEIQLGFLKVLKGSPLDNEVNKWGIVYSNYPPYEVIKTKHLDYKDLVLLKRVEEMVDKYYNSQKFQNILKYFLSKFFTPFEFYSTLGDFFHEKGYFSRNISANDYYRVFIEFNEEILKDDSNVLIQIIKYDFLRFNRKKWMPEFLPKDYIKSTKEIHIEKFSVDVVRFEKTGEINFGTYLVEFNNDQL